jgi:hypothetical protein
MRRICPAGLDIAMHNEPGYPLKGWFIPPQFTVYPETEALVKREMEAFARPEVEPYLDAMPKPETEKLMGANSETSRRVYNKCAIRPKSESEADRYFPR